MKRLANILQTMRARCYRKNHPDFHLYGERGIRICPEWESLAIFAQWAFSNGYAENLTIDRRDNDGPYSPDNCRWITRTQQNRNRRNNQRYPWKGRSLMLSEIAEETGISYNMLRQRVQRRGWELEKAITAPRDNRGGNQL